MRKPRRLEEPGSYFRRETRRSLAFLRFHSIYDSEAWKEHDGIEATIKAEELMDERRENNRLVEFIAADAGLPKVTKAAVKAAVKKAANELRCSDDELEQNVFENLLIELYRSKWVYARFGPLYRIARYRVVDQLRERRKLLAAEQEGLAWQPVFDRTEEAIANHQILDRKLWVLQRAIPEKCHREAILLLQCEMKPAEIARKTLAKNKAGKVLPVHRATIGRWLHRDLAFVDAFRDAFLMLGEPKRTVIDKFVNDGLRRQQIATQLGCANTEIRKLLIQAINDIAEYISGSNIK